MNWTIPGTTLEGQRSNADRTDGLFQSMFLAGGLTLSQTSQITGLEPYTIQNWVKRGFLSKPESKRYTLRQLCRILNINLIKSVMPLEQICQMLSFVNGQLDNEQDDLIDDSVLYFLFVRAAVHYRTMHNADTRDSYLAEVLKDYEEPIPGARARVEKALRTMLTAWIANRMRQEVEKMVSELI